jgi:hypothetical protein
MRVEIPHNLDKATARARLRANSHKISDQFPGGMAQVETSWPNEDTMAMYVRAMGQELHGQVELEEGKIVFNVVLPAALSFIEPIISGAIKQSGQKLIAPPSD